MKNRKPRKSAEQRVKSAKFRIMNERLYTEDSKALQTAFVSDPALFDAYHEQFRMQTRKWTINPVELFIQALRSSDELVCRALRPLAGKCIIDVGCGDAQISAAFPELAIRSFDLVQRNERVTAANAENLPLKSASVDLAIYSLSLMGDPTRMLREASRVLRIGGVVWIAEVGSRCAFEHFRYQLERCGFRRYYVRDCNFFWVQCFGKQGEFPEGGAVEMKPCVYKRR